MKRQPRLVQEQVSCHNGGVSLSTQRSSLLDGCLRTLVLRPVEIRGLSTCGRCVIRRTNLPSIFDTIPPNHPTVATESTQLPTWRWIGTRLAFGVNARVSGPFFVFIRRKKQWQSLFVF